MFNDEKYSPQENNFGSGVVVTIVGQSTVIIEGVKKVLSITGEEIIVKLSRLVNLVVLGTELSVNSIDAKMCCIVGKISGVTYEAR